MHDSAPTLLDHCRSVLAAAERLHATTTRAVATLVAPSGKPDPSLLEQHQFAAHGLAWQATYVEALRQALGWAEKLAKESLLGDTERAILRLGFVEYAAQLAGGIAMSQTEIVRPGDMEVAPAEVERLQSEPALAALSNRAALLQDRMMLAQAAVEGNFGAFGLDATLEAMRDGFVR